MQMPPMAEGTAFLPVTPQELQAEGITQPDFVYFFGDAYVDHPSFGPAIISRVLQSEGFSVAMVPQPDWRNDKDFTKFGRPRLAFLVSAGNIDSMVAHYTSAKKLRSTDAYSPGAKAGKRPDRAVTVYSKRCKECYPDIPVLIGGVEASLRRFAHYDYWDDAVHPSVLVSSGADLLMFGMGERSILEIAHQLNTGKKITEITDVRGTCYLTEPKNTPIGAVQCPSFEEVLSSKKAYAKACRQQYDAQDEVYGKIVIQRHGNQMLVQNPPALSLETEDLDKVYALSYTRTYHPMYEEEGGVPAIEEVRFSIAHNRGCFGFCNFCSIALHQGRRISIRSKESVIGEAKLLTGLSDFKGYIHDVGGPTANFRHLSCEKQRKLGLCKGKKCLAPTVCPNVNADQSDYLELLREMRKLPKIKKIFIRSGIRFDYMLADKKDDFFKDLVAYHVSGQLKVAPEHCSNGVLDKMGKPHIESYLKFREKFMAETKRIGKEQYMVPYFMSSHPGSTLKDAIALACMMKEHHIRPEQVQDFYPTPGTISTCMFYTELDPYTMEPVFVPKTPEEKSMQRALLQYFRPDHYALVKKALLQAGRRDLIGNGEKCLISDKPPANRKEETWHKRDQIQTETGRGSHPKTPRQNQKAPQRTAQGTAKGPQRSKNPINNRFDSHSNSHSNNRFQKDMRKDHNTRGKKK